MIFSNKNGQIERKGKTWYRERRTAPLKLALKRTSVASHDIAISCNHTSIIFLFKSHNFETS